MKTTMKLFVILLTLVMQVSNVCADDNSGSPVFLTKSKNDPIIGGNAGPRRAPARPCPLYLEIFLSEDGSSLNLYNPDGNTITYSIINEDDQEVAAGTISFAGQPNASISLETLDYGIYFLQIVANGVTYEGEFGLEE